MKEISFRHKKIFIKFILLCALLMGYFIYLSYKYDVITGGIASLITWSFFVLCTPIADAGFLLDFPLRLLFGVRMVISEIVVWITAILINIISFKYAAIYYETTIITKLLHKIIVTPYPYWAIILLSVVGTFLSILFGDKLMDILHHHDSNFFHSHYFKYELILFIFFLMVIFGYYKLISSLGINL